ncbi:hypothetical protein F5I97DRAFT_1930698 [Phlebopus sp. FC_14]|nr:hypothetical protein F5I97DRAFT_1930698 [Phlebopus sp. FC_14]
MNHPYGASSSLMYANVYDYGGRIGYGRHPRDPSPQQFQSFMPSLSTDSLPWISGSATAHTGESARSKARHITTDGSLYLHPSLGKRIWLTLKGLGGSVKRRRLLRGSSFPIYARPCHYNVDNDSGNSSTLLNLRADFIPADFFS